uniref:Uncharacterized protein n=1 Tax=Glossina brevipalpis TaxID=37001 RepID=A0A1A9W830_9MUSC
MESYAEQLHNPREFLFDYINNLFQFLSVTHEESNYVLNIVILFSFVFLLCAFAGGAIHIMRNNRRRSLKILQEKICKSDEMINFLLETIKVIKEVYEKSMEAADYGRIHLDRISAQDLLDYLDRKEATEAVKSIAKKQETP